MSSLEEVFRWRKCSSLNRPVRLLLSCCSCAKLGIFLLFIVQNMGPGGCLGYILTQWTWIAFAFRHSEWSKAGKIVDANLLVFRCEIWATSAEETYHMVAFYCRAQGACISPIWKGTPDENLLKEQVLSEQYHVVYSALNRSLSLYVVFLDDSRVAVFEQICVPFINFCYSGSVTSAASGNKSRQSLGKPGNK